MRTGSLANAALFAIGFLVANLAYKFALIRLNVGEYTDGILQLTVFEKDSGLYPPLYGWLAHLIARFGIDLEFAGRAVSIVAGSLAVVPVYFLAWWIAGSNAALFAAVFYTVSPLPTRWSLHVMTDTLFLLLSAAALLLVVISWTWSAERTTNRRRAADWGLAFASCFAALSAITRYQGVLLAPIILSAAVLFIRAYRSLPWRTIVLSLTWITLPLWLHNHRFVHAHQFSERTAQFWVATLLTYWNVFESFLLISPYFFGLPIFFFFLVGVFHLETWKPATRAFLCVWIVWTIMILLLQSAFGSFQYRYMLPLLPACLAVAGNGCSWLEQHFTRHRQQRRFSVLLLGSLTYVTILTCAVLIFQRQAFGDQREAAEYVREHVPPTTPVFANELYGNFTDLGCVKLSFWSGRTVTPVFSYLPRRAGYPPARYMPAGSLVILGNYYQGDEELDGVIAKLQFYYHMRELPVRLDYSLYPIMDDIMIMPNTNQNPTAWVWRYIPQIFSTHIFVLDSPRTAQEMQDILDRQIVPPGTKAVRGRNGRLEVFRPEATTATESQK